MEVIRLDACSLASKFGFGDGDVVGDFILDSMGFEYWAKVDHHEVLTRLVRERLLPRLPSVEVEEITTCHNPIRAVEAWREYCLASSVYVEVTLAEVAALAQQMYAPD